MKPEEIINKINALTKREKVIVGVLMLILSSLPFFYTTIPNWNQYIESHGFISKNKGQISETKKRISNLEKLKKDNASLSKKIEAQKDFLPQTYEIDFLVQDLKDICDASSIELQSFTPSDSEPINIILEEQLESESTQSGKNTKIKQVLDKLKGQDLPVDLYRYPIEVRVNGDFTDIVELLKKLERYGRVISVDNIAIAKGGSARTGDSRFSRVRKSKTTDDSSLTSNFQLVTYSLPSREESLTYGQLKKNLSSFTIQSKRRAR